MCIIFRSPLSGNKFNRSFFIFTTKRERVASIYNKIRWFRNRLAKAGLIEIFKAIIEFNIRNRSLVKFNGHFFPRAKFWEQEFRTHFRFNFKNRRIKWNILERLTIKFIISFNSFSKELTSQGQVRADLDFAFGHKGSLNKGRSVHRRHFETFRGIEQQISLIVFKGYIFKRFRLPLMSTPVVCRIFIGISHLNRRSRSKRKRPCHKESCKAFLRLHSDNQLTIVSKCQATQMKIVHFFDNFTCFFIIFNRRNIDCIVKITIGNTNSPQFNCTSIVCWIVRNDKLQRDILDVIVGTITRRCRSPHLQSGSASLTRLFYVFIYRAFNAISTNKLGIIVTHRKFALDTTRATSKLVLRG